LPRPAAVAVVLAALALAAPAAGHVTVFPHFLPAEGTAALSVIVPNERGALMTGLDLTFPSGFRIVAARSEGSWRATAHGSKASWAGGNLAPGASDVFVVEVQGPPEPGVVDLEADLRYPDGQTVFWPVQVTVTPADEASSHLWRALGVAVVGVLVIVGLAALAWRRRERSLQER